MRKKIISLVAAAALVGSVGIISNAQAGTISLSGDTTATLYGFTELYTGWGTQLAGDWGHGVNVSAKDHLDTGATAAKYNKTHFGMTANNSRFGFVFHNKAENIMAKIEGDFASTYRLRKAYVRHFFANGMALTLGQDGDLVINNTFSAANNPPAGFNGGSRGPEIKLQGKFGAAGACVSYGLLAGNQDYVGNTNRRTLPTFEGSLSFGFNTGLGAPASIYGFGVIEPVEIAYNGDEHGKSPYGYGVGVVLPVSMFTLQSEYIHGYGMTDLAGVTKVKDLEMNSVSFNLSAPASYYYDSTNNKLVTRKFNAYNIEAKIAPLPYMSVAGGWDYLEFKNDGASNDVANYDLGNVKRVSTIFANASFKTTAKTSLTLEWDHYQTKWVGEDAAKNKTFYDDPGNAFFMTYKYVF